jgi:hypothetical protein
MGTTWGNAAALEAVDARSPPSCAEWRRRTYGEGAALTLQEISRKKPGVENRVAQEIEEAITARAFGWIDDAISASTIALRRRCSGVDARPLAELLWPAPEHRNGDKGTISSKPC